MAYSNRLLLTTLTLVVFSCWQQVIANELPNIVMIYTDDVGYGDLSCYGGVDIPTPHLDKLASNGLRFTNAHSTSATCTPSRFGLMTGMYPWRRSGTGVAPGNAGSIIETMLPTMPAMLQKAGYKTAAVGKWHLGLGPKSGPDWNGEITPGPNELGFDYCFIIPATVDRVPCVYVENHRVVGLEPDDPIEVNYAKKIGAWPTGLENPELLTMKSSHGHNNTIVNGIGRIGYMTGGKNALWVDTEIADTVTGKAVDFIKANKDAPFFLYFATHDIHVPRSPHERYAGKSGHGARGDVIMQLDGSVGEIMKTLDELGLTDNTLVIFSSDNGPVVDDGYHDESIEQLGNHRPTGPFRGAKYSGFEGGTRIPLIVHWPNRIKKPDVSNALFSQIDFFASFASLANQSLADGTAPDSCDALPTLLGESKEGREFVIEHAGMLSYVTADWKYIPPSPGGKNIGGPLMAKGVPIETARDTKQQLYRLNDDLSETKNIAEEFPEIVDVLKKKLDSVKEQTLKNGE